MSTPQRVTQYKSFSQAKSQKYTRFTLQSIEKIVVHFSAMALHFIRQNPLNERSLFIGICVISLFFIASVYFSQLSGWCKNLSTYSVIDRLESYVEDRLGYPARPRRRPTSQEFPCTIRPPLSSTSLSSSGNSTSIPCPNPYVDLLGPKQMSSRKTKKILLWTTSWGQPWVESMDPSCPVSCVVTSNRSELDQSDVVAFYYCDMKITDLPPRRSPHQAWMYCDWESPCLTFIKFKEWENLFNWTITYRRDADIYHPYGRVVKLSPEERGRVNNTWEKQRRSKLAVWMATNCNDHAKRKDIVTELAKYVPVDTFGKCGAAQLPKECGRYKDIFCPHLLRDYKFYLAFENAICRDYLTEKVWNAYHRDQVPVVLGGGVDYTHLLPPHSYITVSQFPDIQALAEYLRYLASHPKEYNKYFEWKKSYKVTTDSKWCQVCEAIHDTTKQAQVYWNLNNWLYKDLDTCSCHDNELV